MCALVTGVQTCALPISSAGAGNLEIGPELCEQRGNLFGGADGRGRFEDDEIADLKLGRDRARGRENMADVGAMFLVVRRRHRDDEDIGGGDLGRCDKRAARHDALDEAVEIDFLDMYLAVFDGVDDMLADLDAGY